MINNMEYGNYYIYCITRHTKDLSDNKIQGFHEEAVFFIGYKELVAYVSMTSFTYLEANYDNLKRHEDVIGGVMKECAVLPMRFSTICKSKDKVIAMLQDYYPQFMRGLVRVEGKVEMGIKVFYKLNFEQEDKQDKELIVKPKDYMMRRYERFRMRQSRIDEVLKPIEEFHKKLSEIAKETISTKPLKNNLIFNASYLVDRERRHEFNQAVMEMIHQNPTYKIHYSGPWPAYHFVNIDKEEVNHE